jgi:hypothetical protein
MVALTTPSNRDFEAYRLTAVEGLSTREAGYRLAISQTRICQVRARVLAWIGAQLAAMGPVDPAQQLAAARYLAVERLDYLYMTSMRAFNESAEDGKRSRTARSYGKTCYLSLAMRVVMEMSKLPRPPELLLGSNWITDEQEEPPDHPKGACSAAADEQALERMPDEPAVDGTADALGASDEQLIAEVLQKMHAAGFSAPVQTGEAATVTVPSPPLNRHQRRARQRLLEKKLKAKRRR